MDDKIACKIGKDLAEKTEQDIRSRMVDGKMKCSQCCAPFILSEMTISTQMENMTILKDGETTARITQRNRYLCRHCSSPFKGGC